MDINKLIEDKTGKYFKDPIGQPKLMILLPEIPSFCGAGVPPIQYWMPRKESEWYKNLLRTTSLRIREDLIQLECMLYGTIWKDKHPITLDVLDTE